MAAKGIIPIRHGRGYTFDATSCPGAAAQICTRLAIRGRASKLLLYMVECDSIPKARTGQNITSKKAIAMLTNVARHGSWRYTHDN